MIKIFNKVKQNILVYDLAFVCINILINFILYLINIRFRFWVIILIILISIVGFVIGMLEQIYISSENKKKAILLSLLVIIPIMILALVFLPIIGFVSLFNYKPEHVTILDNKKYVAVVSSFINVDVDYYDYYGFLLMGTKVRVHGDFGKGGLDPFNNPNIADGVEYTYYDNSGKVKSKRIETFVKDKDGKIIENNKSTVDLGTATQGMTFYNQNGQDYMILSSSSGVANSTLSIYEMNDDSYKLVGMKDFSQSGLEGIQCDNDGNIYGIFEFKEQKVQQISSVDEMNGSKDFSPLNIGLQYFGALYHDLKNK